MHKPSAAAPSSVNFVPIPCPRCGDKTEPRTTDSSVTGMYRFAGALGAMIAFALKAQYYCVECGLIPVTEFSPQSQHVISQRKLRTIVMGVGLTIFLVLLLFSLISFRNSRQRRPPYYPSYGLQQIENGSVQTSG